MPKAEAAFILALGLHHGYWVNLRETKKLRKDFPLLRKGMTIELQSADGKARKTLEVMELNDRPYSIKVMDPDGDKPVARGDWLVW